MLSRGPSDASNRLRRSKTSTSVNSRRPNCLAEETIVDPETARRHAITAAHIAMDRANGRSSAEMTRPTGVSRHGSNTDTKGAGWASRSDKMRSCRDSRPYRQRSAIQLKSPIMTSSTHISESNSYPHVFTAAGHPPLSEFGIPDGYGSTPSSYRRLRKTKSMLAHQSRCRFGQDLPSQGADAPRTLRNVRSSLGDEEGGLRLGLRRSMSFLKMNLATPSRSLKRSQSLAAPQGASFGRAKEQLASTDLPRPPGKFSSLFTPNVWDQNVIPSSPCPSPTTSRGNMIWPEYQQKKEASRFRSFSASLKETVRRVLGRSSDRDGGIPVQQLDASRPHFGDYLDGAHGGSGLGESKCHQSCSESRRSVYVPSLEREAPAEDFEALCRKLRSSRSSDSLHSNGRSRLTSWTNSTVANSFPYRGSPVEAARLSIIQENGVPYQPSSSVGRHMDEVFTVPLPLSARQGNAHPTSPIDSKRVYSALMKRIDLEQDEQDRARVSKPHAGQISRSGLTSHEGSFQTTPTIRHVVSEESLHATPTNHPRFGSNRHGSLTEATGSPKPPQEPQEHQILGERSIPRPVFDAHPSPFPSNEIRVKRPNPYRVALATCPEQHVSSDEEDSSVIVTRPRQHGIDLETSSESQYSRTPSGQLFMAGMDRSQEQLSEEPSGMVTIVPNPISRRPCSTQFLTQTNGAKSDSDVRPKFDIDARQAIMQQSNSRLGTAHYREGAQIHGDDTNVGGRPRRSAECASEYTVRTGKDGSQPNNGRPPLLEVTEVPEKAHASQRRIFSFPRKASSAATGMKKSGLAVVGSGQNDENARTPSNAASLTTESPFLASKYSDPEFKGGEQSLGLPGGLQARYKLRTREKNLGGRKSLVAFRRRRADVGEAPTSDSVREAEVDLNPSSDAYHIRTGTESQDPAFDYHGDEHGAKCTPEVGIDVGAVRQTTPPAPPSSHLNHGKTALPTTAFSGPESNKNHDDHPTSPAQHQALKRRERGHKMGMSMDMGVHVPTSSKRMVSNFLRSRRRNRSTGTGDDAAADADEEGRGGGRGEGLPSFAGDCGGGGGEQQQCQSSPAFV